MRLFVLKVWSLICSEPSYLIEMIVSENRGVGWVSICCHSGFDWGSMRKNASYFLADTLLNQRLTWLTYKVVTQWNHEIAVMSRRIQSCDGKWNDGSVADMLVTWCEEWKNCFLIITCLPCLPGNTLLQNLFIGLKFQKQCHQRCNSHYGCY